MTNRKTAWDKIAHDPERMTARRATKPPALPFYWGKDTDDNCLLIAELEGDHREYYFKNVMSFSGVKTKLQQLPKENKQRLVMTLAEHVDRDIFDVLCRNLLKTVEDIQDSRIALSVILKHLKRWKAFMSGNKTKFLSPREVRGLFSELLFLLKLINEQANQRMVIEAWGGPLDAHQDFIFSNTAVEVKSITGKERNAVRISSEDQLQASVDSLFLKVFRLGSVDESSKVAKSLNQLVIEVEKQISDKAVTNLFLERLAATGYVPLDEYSRPHFILLDETTYLIDGEFPKLVKSNVMPGVHKVKYDIDLAIIEKFICGNDIELEQ